MNQRETADMRRVVAGFVILVLTGSLLLLAPHLQSQSPRETAGVSPAGPNSQTEVPAPPILSVIDADKDGEISADELDNAAVALKRLDKDRDGQIVESEMTPDFGDGPQGSPGFGSPGFGPPDFGRPRFGGRRGRGPGGPGGFAGGAAQRIEPQDIPFHDGLAEIPDHATYHKLSYRGPEVMIDTFLANLEFVKFTLDRAGTDDQALYFINTKNHRAHMMFARAAGLPFGRGDEQMKGVLVYRPMLKSPNGQAGLYTFEFEPFDAYSFRMVNICREALIEKMPLLKGRLGYFPRGDGASNRSESEKELYAKAGLPVLRDQDLLSIDVAYLPLNPGRAFGLLRRMELDQRPGPRDVVLYESLPNEMPRVAGIITAVRQTPLSHVNLRAIQDRIPNAFIADAAADELITPLIGKYVHYAVTPDGYVLREDSRDEVESHFAKIRPAKDQIPPRDLTVKEIRSLDSIAFGDAKSVGVKAANVATLRTFGFPSGTVPGGVAVPFYFYDEFMKHNGFYEYAKQMLAHPQFVLDRDTQEAELAKFRSLIKKGKMPDWMMRALHEAHLSFPPRTSVRCRSSTNNEDLPGFSGAGLYDSFTHKPDEGHLSKSIKQVYASLWNFRALEEREFYRVDHFTAAMGVLIHPNFKDELANGVAVTDDILYQTDGNYYVNTQIGEDLVTNPELASIPEELLLDWWESDDFQMMRTSNRMDDGQMLLSPAHREQLRDHLGIIHGKFAKLYGRHREDNSFAMEIEFKITEDGKLAIKQARPWVYGNTTDSN